MGVFTAVGMLVAPWYALYAVWLVYVIYYRLRLHLRKRHPMAFVLRNVGPLALKTTVYIGIGIAIALHARHVVTGR